MDGTSYVTQCPIQPFNTFTYRFVAEDLGTHWYHSHTGAQLIDGLYGLLVVYGAPPQIPQHLVTVSDWLPVDVIQYQVRNPFHKTRTGTGDLFLLDSFKHFIYDNHEVTSFESFSILVNGRGRSLGKPYPLTTWTVTPGSACRFRIVHTGLDASLQISIDEHQLAVVSSDGNDVTPAVVDVLMIHPGETFDVEVRLDRPVDNYWFRVSSLRKGFGPFPEKDDVLQQGKAILRYEGSPATDPVSVPSCSNRSHTCLVLNCPFNVFSVDMNRTCLPLTSLRSTQNQDVLNDLYGLRDTSDDVIHLVYNFAFPVGSAINGRKYIETGVPLSQDDSQKYITPCDDVICDAEGCSCSHVQHLPGNRTVEMILASYTQNENNMMAHHTAHLHGHHFAVLSMGFPPQDPDTGFWSNSNPDLQCSPDPTCTCVSWSTDHRPVLNTEQPAVKSTVIIPARGYVVVRFRTDNPGFWFFHCHSAAHTAHGMAMVFNEAPEQHIANPTNFPRCGNFDWSPTEYWNKPTHNGKIILEIVTDSPGMRQTSSPRTRSIISFQRKGVFLLAPGPKLARPLPSQQIIP